MKNSEKEKNYGRNMATASVAAAAAAVTAPVIGGFIINRRRKALDDDDFIASDAAGFVTARGEKTEINGINLLDFTFGCREGNELIPGGVRASFEALKARFGDYGAREIFGKCFENVVSPSDIKEIAKAGINCVRLPVRSFLLFKEEKVSKKDKPHLKRLDKFISKCAKSGIYVILTCSDAPGYNPDAGEYGIFEMGKKAFSKRSEFVRMCSEISTHYKDNPAVLGYELPFAELKGEQNEKDKKIYFSLCIRTAKALRTLNDRHLIFADSRGLPDDTAELKSYGFGVIADMDSQNLNELMQSLPPEMPLTAVSEGAFGNDEIIALPGDIGRISGYFKGSNTDNCIYCKPKDFIDTVADSYDEICEKVSKPSLTENFMKLG